MTDTFSDIANLDYPIIDADAHVNEPPDTWSARVPAKWRERAPRVERVDGADIWVFDGGRERWPVGLTAVAGQSYFQMSPTGQTYETMRPGSFETKARLDDMDADGIFAQVLYPSVTLRGARIYSGERELQLACVRAYNEWLLEFCEGSGGRLIGQAILPTTGLDDILAEAEWAREQGHRGGVISSFPNGGLSPSDEDEPFWARAEEAGFPVIDLCPPLREAYARGEDDVYFRTDAHLTPAGHEVVATVLASELAAASDFERRELTR